MLAADFVFALTPDFKQVLPTLPTSSPEFRSSLIKTIEDSGLFHPAVRIPDPVFGGAALIYKALPSFGSFAETKNLNAIAGPYPQWFLPRVRWGSGGSSELIAEGQPGATAQLLVQARAMIENQTLAIEVNGEPKLEPVKMTYAFQGFEVPITYDPSGRTAITLRYGTPAANAVLFKALVVR